MGRKVKICISGKCGRKYGFVRCFTANSEHSGRKTLCQCLNQRGTGQMKEMKDIVGQKNEIKLSFQKHYNYECDY